MTIAIMLIGTLPAHAQAIPSSLTPAAGPTRPSLARPFMDTLGDIRNLPTRDNLDWLAVGLAAAFVAHHSDARIARDWSETSKATFKPGAIVGGTPFELGAAFATFAIG